MVTIFAIPKPFRGHVGMIQRNALRSWARLGGVDIVLIGDDDGVSEAAAEVGARHIAAVETTDEGTPIVSAAFRLVQGASAQPFLAYVNADIILLPDFVRSLRRVRSQHFLLVGQRWNTDLREAVRFDDPQWEQNLRSILRATADLASPRWVDYFVLPRDSPLIDDLPSFAVGRPRWDNWMIRRARFRGIPVIDATPSIAAVHQRHDYSHIPGGTGHEWYGPEATANMDLFGGGSLFSIWHATHVLTRWGQAPAVGLRYVSGRWGTRHEVDGGIERVGRWLEPLLAPALRIRHRIGGSAETSRQDPD